MKKILSIILSVMMVVTMLASCTAKDDIETNVEKDEVIDAGVPGEDQNTENNEENAENNDEVPEVDPEAKPEVEPEVKPEVEPEVKPEVKPEVEPEVKPEPEINVPAADPEVEPEINVPAVNPEETPEVETPEVETPEVNPEDSTNTDGTTAGDILLKDFKDRIAAGETSAQALADALIQHPMIQFMGGTMPMEEGFLSGFNEEIHGFKEAVMFCPMIGAIPFVGYVFEIENEADVPAFIQTLKDNANLRWLICAQAEEMVVEAVGNKVFFVMCKTDLSAE